VQKTTLPGTGGVHGPIDTQYPEAQPILDQLKNLQRPSVFFPNAVPPKTVKVVVVDGSGVTGRAADVQSALVRRGFRAGGSADAGGSAYPKTQVRYAPGQATKGLTVALYLGTANVVEAASTSVQDGSRILRGDVLVVIGRDYPSLRGLLAQSVSSTTVTS
jgi:hypothetical protein